VHLDAASTVFEQIHPNRKKLNSCVYLCTQIYYSADNTTINNPLVNMHANAPNGCSSHCLSFRLEDLEGPEHWQTQVFLHSNSTVTLGKTDGPKFVTASGTWKLFNETFEMSLARHFPAGPSFPNATYCVERSYVGELHSVGETAGMQGVLKDEDQNVGYFEMIDTSDLVNADTFKSIPRVTKK
jgi:hypothetical protein